MHYQNHRAFTQGFIFGFIVALFLALLFCIIIWPSSSYAQSSLDTNDKLLDLIAEMKDTAHDAGFESGFTVAIECVTTAYLQSKYGKTKRTVHEINEFCYQRYNVKEK